MRLDNFVGLFFEVNVNFSKIDIIWNTVKYLKPIQWRYRAKLWWQRFFSTKFAIIRYDLG